MIDNQTLGYFIARIFLFLTKIGIDPSRLRFRQHMSNEMAHYAADCWDAEILTSYGWIECVGCADRSAYDLTVHAAKTKQKMMVSENLKEPRVELRNIISIEKKVFGPLFKKEAKLVEEAIMTLGEEDVERMAVELKKEGKFVVRAADGQDYTVPATILSVEKKSFNVTSQSLLPLSSSPTHLLLPSTRIHTKRNRALIRNRTNPLLVTRALVLGERGRRSARCTLFTA